MVPNIRKNKTSSQELKDIGVSYIGNKGEIFGQAGKNHFGTSLSFNPLGVKTSSWCCQNDYLSLTLAVVSA